MLSSLLVDPVSACRPTLLSQAPQDGQGDVAQQIFQLQDQLFQDNTVNILWYDLSERVRLMHYGSSRHVRCLTLGKRLRHTSTTETGTMPLKQAHRQIS